MTRAFLFAAMLLLAACRDRATSADAGAAPTPAASSVSVTLAPIQKGAKWQVHHESTLAFAAVVNQPDGATQPGETGSGDVVTFTVEVLATDAAEVTKAKLDFTEAKEKGAGPEAVAQPIDNKAYVVEWGPSSATVTRVDGQPGSEREVALVRTHADLVRTTELQLTLAKGPQATKVNLPEVAKAFATMYLRREDAKGGPRSELRDVSATLEERGDAALVRVKGELRTADEQTTFVVTLGGTFEVVRATGLIRSMALEGPVEMELKGRGKSSGHLVESITVK